MPRSNKHHPDGTPEARDRTPDAGSLSCDAVLDRLELYLDGLDGTDGADEGLPGLSAEQTEAVETHLTRCPACAQELSRAERIRDGLRALPDVPFDLPDAAARPAGTEEASEETPPRLLPGPWMLQTRRATRWAVPLAAAAMVILALLWVRPWSPSGPGGDPAATQGPTLAGHDLSEHDLSEAELARAELEARYALARLGEATRRARKEIREDVLARHVVAPVQRELLRSFHAPPKIPDSAGPTPPPTL